MLRLVLTFAGLFILSLPVFAGTLPPQTAMYSANAIYDIDSNHYRSTLVADHGNERRVIQTPYGAQTLLIRLDDGKAYLIQPSLGALGIDLSSHKTGIDITQIYTAEARAVGHDTVEGLSVTKYHLTARPAVDTSFTGDVWSTEDGIFVKIDGTGIYRGKPSRIVVHLSDVRRGAQDPSAFQIPQGMSVVDATPLIKQWLRGGAD